MKSDSEIIEGSWVVAMSGFRTGTVLYDNKDGSCLVEWNDGEDAVEWKTDLLPFSTKEWLARWQG